MCVAFSSFFERGYAQEGDGDGPVYIVKEGDSLWDIALRFRVGMDDLARANGISDPSQLTVGARLVIPGLEGITGELTTRTVIFGDSLRSLSRRYQVPVDALIQLNHLTSPAELYASSTLVIPETSETAGATRRFMMGPGQSLFELAVGNLGNPWEYVLANNLGATWNIIPGEVLHLPGEGEAVEGERAPSSLPDVISEIEFGPTSFIQGKTTVINVSGDEGLNLHGSLVENGMEFFQGENSDYTSLQGIHAMLDPGLYTLVISGTLPTVGSQIETPFSFSQSVLIRSGDYNFDPVLTVSPETIDPAVTRPEDAQWAALASPVTPQKLWGGIFQSPAPEPFSDCWPSLFGSRRSYNGSPYDYFHTGLDFCGGVGTEILAPATGTVVFASPLTVRGNATMIDHGWGIYTGYMHQSEILINVGDTVQPGQLIGRVGGTGRVTGPHLHWEIWVGGIQVDPLDWLETVIP